MPEVWRYIDCGAQDVFETNARMPVLSRQVQKGGRPVATTAAWGTTHLNVGWFDDVDATIDLAACRSLGVQVIRRPVYGGGTAFYQEGCSVIWGFLLPKETHPDLDGELRRFQPVLLDALARVGLQEVGFEGSSDLRWRGRKLGALTAQDVVRCNSIGGFLNTRPPDLDVYLQVVRIPDDKFEDELVKDMREYVATAQEVSGRPLPYEAFRDALRGALADAGITLEHGSLTDEEREGIAGVANRIASDDAVRRVSSERFLVAAPAGTRVGFGNEKGRKLCRAGVAIARDGTVAAAMMAGDMHVGPPDTMDRVASALSGAPADDEEELRARIASVFEAPDVHQADATMGVTTEDLLGAVRKAVAQAQAAPERAGAT